MRDIGAEQGRSSRTTERERFRALMERVASILRSYAGRSLGKERVHALWNELAQDMGDWAGSVHSADSDMTWTINPACASSRIDPIHAFERAVHAAEQVGPEAETDRQLMAALGMKTAELDVLHTLTQTRSSWQWRKPIVFAQVRLLADVLLQQSAEPYVLRRALELIDHARVVHSKIG